MNDALPGLFLENSLQIGGSDQKFRGNIIDGQAGAKVVVHIFDDLVDQLVFINVFLLRADGRRGGRGGECTVGDAAACPGEVVKADIFGQGGRKMPLDEQQKKAVKCGIENG